MWLAVHSWLGRDGSWHVVGIRKACWTCPFGYGLVAVGSPLGYADRITAPLLVVHGANDTRVSPEASDAVVARLRGLGREVDFVPIEGEGHGFADRETFARVQRLAADWLLTHLKDTRA